MSLDFCFILDCLRIFYILHCWCLSQCCPQTWNSEFSRRLGSRLKSSPRDFFFLIQFYCHWSQQKNIANVQQNDSAECYSYMQYSLFFISCITTSSFNCLITLYYAIINSHQPCTQALFHDSLNIFFGCFSECMSSLNSTFSMADTSDLTILGSTVSCIHTFKHPISQL